MHLPDLTPYVDTYPERQAIPGGELIGPALVVATTDCELPGGSWVPFNAAAAPRRGGPAPAGVWQRDGSVIPARGVNGDLELYTAPFGRHHIESADGTMIDLFGDWVRVDGPLQPVLAIAYGATTVRVGEAIFGPRR